MSASAAIIFAGARPRTALPFFVLAVVLAAAMAVHYQEGSLRQAWQYPRYRINELTLAVVSDSKEIKGGREVLGAEILKYGGQDTEELQHSSRVTVFITGRGRYFRGEIIHIRYGKYIKAGSVFLSIPEKNLTRVSWSSPLLKLRGDLLHAVYRKLSFLNRTSQKLFTAFFLGKKGDPSDPLFRNFTHAGASHLLALSGMHLGILSGGIMLALSPLMGKKRSFVTSLPLLLGYLFFAGASPSLLRAYIFLCLIGAGILAGIKPDYFHILALTFLVHCFITPLSAQTVSFKLSYLALAGIFIAAKPLIRLLPGIIPLHVRSVFAASAGAQIGTLPVVLYFFHTFYPAGLVSSLLLVPLTALFLLLGVAFLFVPQGLLFGTVVFVENGLGNMLSWSAGFFAHIPVPPAALLLTILFLAGYLFTVKKRQQT